MGKPYKKIRLTVTGSKR